eukprot:2288121-Pyramimonas_sp.AAC.1
MGWISATGVFQHIHRRLLRSWHPRLQQLAACEELREDAPMPPARRAHLDGGAVAPVRGQVGGAIDNLD